MQGVKALGRLVHVFTHRMVDFCPSGDLIPQKPRWRFPPVASSTAVHGNFRGNLERQELAGHRPPTCRFGRPLRIVEPPFSAEDRTNATDPFQSVALDKSSPSTPRFNSDASASVRRNCLLSAPPGNSPPTNIATKPATVIALMLACITFSLFVAITSPQR